MQGAETGSARRFGSGNKWMSGGEARMYVFVSAGVIHPNLKGGLLQAQHEWITSVTEFGNVIHIRSDRSIGIGSGSIYFENRRVLCAYSIHTDAGENGI